MGFKADVGFLITFAFEAIYNFFRWTPFGPRKCRIETSLDGKVCVITGATSGIGRQVAKELAVRGAKVVIACRDIKKGREACEEILKESPTTKVEARICDLTSFASIKQFVSEIDSEPHIDILINNAAVMLVPFTKTVDGFETTFQTNYLGHYLLTHLVLDKLKASSEARVVNLVSSSYARAAPEGLNLDDLNYENTSYSSHKAYCRSKLALLWFTRELAKRLEGTSVHVYAAYPGQSKTELHRNLTGIYRFVWRLQGFFTQRSAQLGAQTVLFCATDKETGRESGHYYDDCRLVADKRLKTIATNDESARRLWDVSQGLCALN